MAETIAAALDEEYSVSTTGTVADAVRRLRETSSAVILMSGDLERIDRTARALTSGYRASPSLHHLKDRSLRETR